jgi:hypothetical protein
MTTKDKLIKRFLSFQKDFTIDELSTMLSRFDFEDSNKGKTSGSRIAFINRENGVIIRIHKPYPGKIIKPYVLKEVHNCLKENGFI